MPRTAGEEISSLSPPCSDTINILLPNQEKQGPGSKQYAQSCSPQTLITARLSSHCGPQLLTTEPGSLRSCADSPSSSVSDLYKPSSFSIHRLRLVLSEPASAHGQST